MKILWMCNGSLPVIADYLKENSRVCLGGWLMGLSQNLLKQDTVELIYCYPDYSGSAVRTGTIGRLKFYSLPMTLKDANQEMLPKSRAYQVFSEILRENSPDLIHFFGTEFVYTSALLELCRNLGFGKRTVVSIQGLISMCHLHYEAGLPWWLMRCQTLNELKGRVSLRRMKKNFAHRGEFEQKSLRMTGHIIGRTGWDRAAAEMISPDAEYHFCNETLREEFYTGQWSYENCNPFQIAISQSTYPIKGIHMVVEAVAILVKQFPEIRVVVGGADIFHGNWIKGNTYGNYVRRLIHKNGLDSNFEFAGMLDAPSMKKMMLQSNVFVCPSSIENSPNSLGEAMILGMPCIASDVGGVQDMMERNKEGFVYPFGETYKLAYYLKKVFEGREKAAVMGNAAHRRALVTHDPETNNSRLLEIYSAIINGEELHEG